MTKHLEFQSQCAAEIERQAQNPALKELSQKWITQAQEHKYSYHFNWLGRPIIQYPQDIIAMQELIWKTQPTLIIETGIAHGGSLIFSASMLELNAACGGAPNAKVLGIDIDIRPHNHEAILAHPMSRRIEMIQGSSIDSEIIGRVHARAKGEERILACLDSNHTHAHVLAELQAYAPLVTKDSYCVVFDTLVEDLPKESFTDRPWGPGDNPKTAVHQYLKENQGFAIDKTIQNKLLITVAPDGFLKRS